MEADLLLHTGSFLLIHLTEFQCVSSALIVHCPSAADCTQWLKKTQQAQVCETRHSQGVRWGAGSGGMPRVLELRHRSIRGDKGERGWGADSFRSELPALRRTFRGSGSLDLR